MTKKEAFVHLSATKPVAILVDGGFFLKRYRKCFPQASTHAPATVAKNMYTMLLSHVEKERLYRILFYDCPPLEKKAHYPVSGQSIDFSKTPIADFRREFHDELKKLRKVALRLGYLKSQDGWVIRSGKIKALLDRKITVSDLIEEDFYYATQQKGVDIKIGLDIASLAYKRLVDRIILISGDSDFVPAAKLARREGIDFILDPMWKSIDPHLHEHIDGLKSICQKPKYQADDLKRKEKSSTMLYSNEEPFKR